MSPNRLVLVAPALVGALATSAPASAAEVRWVDAEVVVSVDPSVVKAGPGAVEAAASAWQRAAGVPVLSIVHEPVGAIGFQPGDDNQNAVLYVAEGTPLAKGALAITVVTHEAQSGKILDADVVINGVHRFGDGGVIAGKKASRVEFFDLQSIVTHELGHFLGLGENYAHAGATMYAYAEPAETHKRTLSEHDRQEAEALYGDLLPARSGEIACAVTDASEGEPAPWLIVLGLVGVGAALRRRTRAHALLLIPVALGAVVEARAEGPAAALVHARGGSAPVAFDGVVTETRVRWDGGLMVTDLIVAAPHCRSAPEVCDSLGGVVSVWGGADGDVVQTVAGVTVPRRGERIAVRVVRGEDSHRAIAVEATGAAGSHRNLRVVERKAATWH